LIPSESYQHDSAYYHIKTRGCAVGMSQREYIIVTDITGHFLYAVMEDWVLYY